MSSRYYLSIRHVVIAKYQYEATQKINCKNEYKGHEFIDQYNRTEYWLNVAIKTVVKARHN